MAIFRGNISGVYKDRPEEQGFDITYKASSHDEAIQAAIRFLLNRSSVFDLIPGCIKVSLYSIEEIDIAGNYQTRSSIPLFEWKYDTSPFTIEQLRDSVEARQYHS